MEELNEQQWGEKELLYSSFFHAKIITDLVDEKYKLKYNNSLLS
jgi:hypothetical protein